MRAAIQIFLGWILLSALVVGASEKPTRKPNQISQAEQKKGLLASEISELYSNCGDKIVYRFNSCREIQQRLKSGLYGLCKSAGLNFEILKYFQCESDPQWVFRPFQIDEIEDAVVAGFLIVEIKKEMAAPEAQRNVERMAFLNRTLQQLIEKFPSHSHQY